MKILVTGGGGFVGKAVIERLLRRGDQVTSLGRSPQPELEKLGVTVVQADLADKDAVAQCCVGKDAVFHVAAKAGVWGSPESFVNANVIGTRNILEGCRRHKVPWLVHTSTPSVVFNGNEFTGEDESLPYGSNWLCHYAETKAIAEREVLAANGKEGLSTVALRPHLVWGIGDPHILPRVIRRAKAGKLRIVGDGSNMVDISHVENVADAHILALNALQTGVAAGKPYFLSQGEPVVLWDWINDVLTRLSIPPVTRQISAKKAFVIGSMLELVWKTFGLLGEPPMTRFVAVELAKSHYYSIEAARRDLGYVPKVSTEDGVRAFVADWMAKNDQ